MGLSSREEKSRWTIPRSRCKTSSAIYFSLFDLNCCPFHIFRESMRVFRWKLKRWEAVSKRHFFVKNTSFDPESVFALKDALTMRSMGFECWSGNMMLSLLHWRKFLLSQTHQVLSSTTVVAKDSKVVRGGYGNTEGKTTVMWSRTFTLWKSTSAHLPKR